MQPAIVDIESTDPIAFFVPGRPATAGSKHGFAVKKGGQYTGKVAMVNDNKRYTEWRGLVKHIASQAYRGPLLDGPVFLKARFTLQRPQTHYYHTKARNGQVKDDAPHWVTSKPDSSKIIRALEDSLTGVVWKDDSRVVRLVVEKVYGEKPGTDVEIYELRRRGLAGPPEAFIDMTDV